jgi:hypothetical protein
VFLFFHEFENLLISVDYFPKMPALIMLFSLNMLMTRLLLAAEEEALAFFDHMLIKEQSELSRSVMGFN